jgi:hypothetical protein
MTVISSHIQLTIQCDNCGDEFDYDDHDSESISQAENEALWLCQACDDDSINNPIEGDPS